VSAEATKPAAARNQEVSGTGQITILDRTASFPEVMEIAAQSSGRLATLREFVVQLEKDPDLLERARGHQYWINDWPGPEINGFCRIDHENGSLVLVSKREWKRLPVQDRAYAAKGAGRLVLHVNYGYHAWGGGCLLGVYAVAWPDDVARVAIVALGGDTQNSGSPDAGPATLIRKTDPSAT
jgi:hypothetical protein